MVEGWNPSTAASFEPVVMLLISIIPSTGKSYPPRMAKQLGLDMPVQHIRAR